MKDAKGHGSNARGDHAAGVEKIGNPKIHPNAMRALLSGKPVTVNLATGRKPTNGFMVRA